MEEKNKYTLVLGIIGISISILLAIGISYAYFSADTTGNEAEVNVNASTASKRDVFSTSGETTISLDVTSDKMQYADKGSVAVSDSKTMSVSLEAGSGKATCTYDLTYIPDVAFSGSGLDNELTLEGTNGSKSFGPIDIKGSSNVKLGTFKITDEYETPSVVTSETWTLTGKFNNLDADQNNSINKTFSGVVKATNVVCENSLESEKQTLYAMMEENADTETVINFNVQSSVSRTNGIYMTTNTNSGEPVYYYRGTVDNNLKWGGFCWKIIRTTETRGTKIIYNGTPDERGQCLDSSPSIGSSAYNSTYNDNTYVGYMTGSAGATTYAATHSNTNDSTIKTFVDDWYEENIENKGLTVYLEDTVFCNDRNLVAGGSDYNNTLTPYSELLGYGKNTTGYGVLARSSFYTLNANPSLVCKNTTGFVPEDNDSFTVSSIIGNGKLKYPIGLITTDELIYAGFNTKGEKETDSDYKDENFLSGRSWTMSPVVASGFGAQLSYWNKGVIYSGTADPRSSVTPVVSLRPSTKLIAGSGTQRDPYVVE